MFTTFPHTKRLFLPILVVVLFAQFFVQGKVAEAAATYPGTPQDPTATDNVCFGAAQSFLGFVHQYCYPNMGACTAAYSSVPSVNKDSACLDNYSNRSGVEKAWLWFKQVPGNVTDTALDATGALIMSGVALIAELVNKLAAIFLSSMAYILDASIDRTINPDTYKYLTSVNIGWTAVRDISNMFFIFILLYISIKTILGLAGSDTKRMIAHVIIAALLINFSLFATQVVIDAGNVLATGFWSKISSRQGGQVVSSASAKFMEGFRIQTVTSNQNTADPTGGTQTIDLSPSNRAMINFGGAIVMFVAGYVFLAGAIMMIIRTITLIILMITSPFAFLAFAFPNGKSSLASLWLDKLIGATFVAPAFILMLYLDSIIISNDAFKLSDASSSGFSAAMTGSGDNFGIILNFATMIILLLASITVANSVSSGVAGKAGGFAKKALGYGGGLSIAAAGIAGGRVGRQVGGSTGRAIQNSKKVDEWAKSKNWMVRNIATTAKRTGSTMSKGTWDVRNTGAVGTINSGLKMTGTGVQVNGPLQKGSAKSFETHGGLVGSAVAGGVTGTKPTYYRGTENEKKAFEEAKKLYGKNPEAREAFLRDRKVDLDAQRNFDAVKEMKADAVKLEREANKKKANEELERAKKHQDDIDSGKTTKEASAAEGEEIAKAVKESMAKLTVNERADLAATHGGNVFYASNLRTNDYQTIHRLEAEGKTNGTLAEVTKGVMNSNNANLQDFIMKPENSVRLTMIDQEQLAGNAELMANYNRRIETIKKANAEQEAAANSANKKKEDMQYVRDKMKNAREEQKR